MLTLHLVTAMLGLTHFETTSAKIVQISELELPNLNEVITRLIRLDERSFTISL